MAHCRYCGHERDDVEEVAGLAPCIVDNVGKYSTLCHGCLGALAPKFTTRYKFCAGQDFNCSSNKVLADTRFKLVARRLQPIPENRKKHFPSWAREGALLCNDCYSGALKTVTQAPSPPRGTRTRGSRGVRQAQVAGGLWESDDEMNILDSEDCLRIEPRLNVVRQTRSYDCGLACCAAVLYKITKDADPKQLMAAVEACYKEINENADDDEGVWTIEIYKVLCRVLPREWTAHMYTQQLGVSAEYERDEFYQATFSKDAQRVDALFKQHDPHVTKASLTAHSIADGTSKGNAYIVLVDGNKLGCSCQTLNSEGKSLCYCDDTGPPQPSRPYSGHYVVVVNIDTEKATVYYLNPASICSVCRTSVKNFNDARKAFGTDEDIVQVAQN